MADRALTQEAVHSGLRDIRLPADAAGGLVADLLVALAIGLLLAVLFSWLARIVTLSRPKVLQPSLKRDVQALATLPDADQQIALLHLLKSRAPDRYRAMVDSLYRPGGLPDLATLRTAVLADD